MPELAAPDTPALHVLFVGDSRDLFAIRNMLVELPATAYGQVFIEIAASIQREQLEAPAGVSVTWLSRDRDYFAGEVLPVRGQLVSRAVRAWATEWMPQTATEQDGFVMWVGCSSSPRVSDLYRELSELIEAPRLRQD
jgi:NADPH-dependent ferric siderophore reductase